MISIDILILLLFFTSQFILFIFAIHYFYLIYLFYENRQIYRSTPNIPEIHPDQYPSVTIQIPIYNEKYVISNVISQMLKLDYPKSKLQIQILDDSNDETVDIVKNIVIEARAKDFNIHHIQRKSRLNFKAGALNYGMNSALGELIVIFDADFIPPKDFLRKTTPYFQTNKKLGCLQTRWGHQNADESALTNTIALGIDGHFIVEQNVRSTLDVINFNGTCGIWRKECILDAGGWDGSILAEDLDLSYRAHINGWKIKYLQDVVCLGEIPDSIQSFKQQQYRWAKGSIQSARKNYFSVLKSPNLNRKQKLEATFHHFGYFLQLFMFLLLITTVPLISHPNFQLLSVGLLFSILALAAPSMYIVSAMELNYPLSKTIPRIFRLTLLGIGISFNTGRAAFFGLFQKKGEFKRTPKRGNNPFGYFNSFKWDFIFEGLIILYCLYGIILSIQKGIFFSIPFLSIYSIGIAWVLILTFKQGFEARKFSKNISPIIVN